jgi:hypothetical protein
MYKWMVVLSDGSTQSGQVESFDTAIDAIRAWHGQSEGAKLGDRSYLIDYFPELQAEEPHTILGQGEYAKKLTD